MTNIENYKFADIEIKNGNQTDSFRLESWDLMVLHYRVHVVHRGDEQYELTWWHNATNHYLGMQTVSKSVYDLFIATEIGEDWRQLGVQSQPSLPPTKKEIWLDGKLVRTLPGYGGTEGWIRHIYQCGGLQCEVTVCDYDGVDFRVAIKDENNDYHTVCQHSFWRTHEREYPDYFWGGSDEYLTVEPRRDGTLKHDLYSRL